MNHEYTMILEDISFAQIHIQPPKATKDNQYMFPLTHINEKIVFESKHPYKLRFDDNICDLHIQDKNDLRFFNALHKYLSNQLYEIHEDWFETKFERTKYDAMFRSYLSPNIEENAVNIKCNISEELIKDIDPNSGLYVFPTFELTSILFDEDWFYIQLNVKDLRFDTIEKEVVEPAQESVLEPVLEPPQEPPQEPVLEPVLEPPQEPVLEPAQEPEPDEVVTEIPQEVSIKHSDDLEETHVKLNDDDYFILFKIIESNLKENFSDAVLSVFKDKEIETKNINIQDIVYDSDELMDSDDEYLQNDDFEEQYRNIVN